MNILKKGSKEKVKAKENLVVIMGPTASAKSELALRLALRLNTEIVSADARQVYAGMQIGTAAPSAEAQARIPHHFIGTQAPNQALSAGDMAVQVRKRLRQRYQKHQTLILVGGSGLYIQAICQGLLSRPVPSAAIRDGWRKQPLEVLQAYVSMHAPASSASAIDFCNGHRLARWAECHAAEQEKAVSSSPLHEEELQHPLPYGIHYLVLCWPRAELYDRIQRRCTQMVSQGLVDEARALYERYDVADLPPTIGYNEMYAYFKGQLTKEEALRQFIQNSRHYAKRQLTWLRKLKQPYWALGSDLDLAEAHIIRLLAS